MNIGKVPNDVLKEIVLNKLRQPKKDVLVSPGIGEDCSAVDFEKYACILSSDPITGAAHEVGRLAVHISCNDIASCGVEPLGLMVTILAPPGTSKEDLDGIMDQICRTAYSIDVDILGGHTEITGAVNRFVVVSTAVGKMLKEKLVTSSAAVPGDYLVLTKSAGLEGTAIIAHDKEEELKRLFSIDFIEKAKGYIDRISVVREGIIAGRMGVHAMHDVTEGGVLGALWEIAEASGVGVEVYKENIPVEYETQEICGHFGIDPLKLISSGCMLIACSNGPDLVNELANNGIKAAVIGIATGDKTRILVSNGLKTAINQPESDELYKAV